jgi:hypothetical protein
VLIKKRVEKRVVVAVEVDTGQIYLGTYAS